MRASSLRADLGGAVALRRGVTLPRERAPAPPAPDVAPEMVAPAVDELPAIDLAPGFDEVTFPIDLVYTWVDGDDPAWRARKDQALSTLRLHDRAPDSHDPARYRNRDELRYSLRSVAAHAPWVRHIFIVTDGQVPPWLNADHERITVVDHRDVFPDESWLPTFNSHAIEACLHRIDGLAEHYLYMNDDFFFGREVSPHRFFHANGMTKFFLSPASIPATHPSEAVRSVDAAAANTRELIHDRFGRRATRKIKHVAYPQRRSVLYEMEAVLPEAFARTAANRVRAHDDIAVPSSLYHYYAYLTGRAVPGRIMSRYVSLDERRLAGRLRKLRRRGDFDVLCINDSLGEHVGRDAMRRTDRMAHFMRTYWPEPSEFER